MWYRKELSKKEFVKFKEFLTQEILQMGLKQSSWTKVKEASWEDLDIFLVKHCEGKQALEMTFKIPQKIDRKDLTERETGEIAVHPTIYLVNFKMKLTHDCSRKFNISIQNFLQDEYDHLENLLVPKGTEKEATHGVPERGAWNLQDYYVEKLNACLVRRTGVSEQILLHFLLLLSRCEAIADSEPG